MVHVRVWKSIFVIKQSRSNAPVSETKLGFSANGDAIIASIGSCSVMMSKHGAIKACRDLLALVCG
ncbi:MAG TPA: hypothetical protein VKM55_10575 [Candidatus Lokiarchaeia archaeon]|nr:hypothetical protein [Candidatus Lokiarchaeia archaeon]